MGDYLKIPSRQPYAWSFFYTLLVSAQCLKAFLNNAGWTRALVFAFGLMFFIQIIYNLINLIKTHPRVNIKKIAKNIGIYVLITAIGIILTWNYPL